MTAPLKCQEPVLRPDVRCPRCGYHPAIRIPISELERYLRERADKIVLTYRCHRPGCPTIYPITAGALARAR